MSRLFAISQLVRLTCRCEVYVDEETLYRLVPGAVMRCQDHGLQTLLSKCPRPAKWERNFSRSVRQAQAKGGQP